MAPTTKKTGTGATKIAKTDKKHRKGKSQPKSL